ncbi:uncharacterized protein DUF892 [Cereibacter ovatus]|uniref:Uncharacterized protein DUF892 n=1 Tax=Cereibacter ovatus TaxID=439529 RepID=A0A285CKZ7_9RHOB|nr:DUF892 family protein [Cereibacter ovatus]SNX67738.1 uncharacterized protein DUF892 [Cereibacter ovatus]
MPMASVSKHIGSMDDLFTHLLQDIYDAEKQIENALPKMAGKACDATLR